MVELLVESSVLIILVLALRTIFGGLVNYRILYGLWGLVALRLLLPVPLVQTSVNVMQVWHETSAILHDQSVKWDNGKENVEKEKYDAENETDRPEQASSQQDVLKQQDSPISTEPEMSSKAQQTDTQKGNLGGTATQREQESSSYYKQKTSGEASADTPENQESSASASMEKGEQTGKQGKNAADASGTEHQIKNPLSYFRYLVQKIGIEEVIFGIWCAGILICLAILISGNISLYRKLCRDRKLYMGNGRYPDHKIGQHLRIYTTSVLSSPCLYGCLRPGIYLPKDLVEEISDSKLEQIIVHEQTHYRHGDHIWSVLRMLLVSIYWFDPFVWIAAASAKRDAELACDEAVVLSLGEGQRHDYAAMLLEVAERRQSSRVFCSVTTMSRQGKHLEKRIRALGAFHRFHPVYLLPFVVVVLCVAGITFTGVKVGDLSRKRDTQQTVHGRDNSTDNQKKRQSEGVANTASVSDSDTASLELSDKMTMEELVRLCAGDMIGQVTSEQFMGYQNAERTKDSADDLAYHIVYDGLEFSTDAYKKDGYYDDGAYRLSVDVDKASGTVDMIRIGQLDTDQDDMLTESATLYVGEEYPEFAPYVKSLAEFLDHDDILDDTIHYVLPEGLLEGRCVYGLTGTYNDPGRLFMTRKQMLKDGIYGYQNTLVWSADGGMMPMELGVDADGLLYMTLSHYDGNGRGAVKGVIRGEGKDAIMPVDVENGTASVEAIQIQPEAYLGDLRWYHPECYTAKNYAKTRLTKKMGKKLLPRKLWIGCIQPENTSVNTEGEAMGYVFFLDQEKYTKQDMMDLLHSVRVYDDYWDADDALRWTNLGQEPQRTSVIQGASYAVWCEQDSDVRTVLHQKEQGAESDRTYTFSGRNLRDLLETRFLDSQHLILYFHEQSNSGCLKIFDLKQQKEIYTQQCKAYTFNPYGEEDDRMDSVLYAYALSAKEGDVVVDLTQGLDREAVLWRSETGHSIDGMAYDGEHLYVVTHPGAEGKNKYYELHVLALKYQEGFIEESSTKIKDGYLGDLMVSAQGWVTYRNANGEIVQVQ